MKSTSALLKNSFGSRSPYGERGLKLHRRVHAWNLAESLSLRRAWIEIPRVASSASSPRSRSPYGERGLKLRARHRLDVGLRSLSLRRAWIEISMNGVMNVSGKSLSLRRAWIEILKAAAYSPATRRSPYGERGLKFVIHGRVFALVASLSLRRAWIEISLARLSTCSLSVALLTESVD